MNLLLDSPALLWALAAPDVLRPEAASAIRDRRHAVFYSAASVWELELKSARGKLRLPARWVEHAQRAGFVELPLDAETAAASTRLPWHHADPFDRLLVAQARERGLTLATRDPWARLYPVPLLKV